MAALRSRQATRTAEDMRALDLAAALASQGAATAHEIDALGIPPAASAGTLIQVLRQAAIVSDGAIAQAFAEITGLPLARDDEWPAGGVPGGLSLAFLRANKVLPLALTSSGLTVAIADPTDTYALRAVRLATDQPVDFKLATHHDIERALERLVASGASEASPEAPSTAARIADEVQHLRDLALGTPVVTLLDQLLKDAVTARATDIHIEPYQDRISVRLRIDGVLREVRGPPASMSRAIVSRVKLLAGLDISERRVPLDGRSKIVVDQRELDVRVATMPVVHGESVAIRLLDNVRRKLDLARLGFGEAHRERLTRHLNAPHGLLIVTGPTGSGKTTTLAAGLALLNSRERKIMTLEDPIEYELEGINQTQVRPGIGLTFASALRSMLRHDPDVIMVGEMRDSETALIGVQAALTGHLVLTTLHTNSAAGAFARLLDLKVDAYLLASSVRCVVGQRLVRMLCPSCRTPGGTTDLAMRNASGVEPEWSAVGCARCSGTGYVERIAIAEVLDVTEGIRELIKPGVSTAAIEARARADGFLSMLDDGRTKCRQGLTTITEVRRATVEG